MATETPTSCWRTRSNGWGRGFDTIYINDGSGRFSDQTVQRLPGGPSATTGLELVDIDLDGDLDVYFANSGLDELYLNDGRGFFRDASTLLERVFLPAISLRAADVDGDGDVDLIAGMAFNRLVPQPSLVKRNLYRQVELATVPRIGQPLTIEAFATPGLGQSVQVVRTWLSLRLSAPAVTLPVFGRLYLDLVSAIAGPQLVVLPATGSQTVTLTLPNSATLAGRELFVQGLVLPSANVSDWRLTNVSWESIRR